MERENWRFDEFVLYFSVNYFKFFLHLDTKWNVPKEGYMTLEEYNRLNKLAEAQQQLQLHKESMFMRGNADEIVAK